MQPTEREPNNFCQVAGQKCYMNYCDENGCQDRKRRYTALGMSRLNSADLLAQLLKNQEDKEQVELVVAEITERLATPPAPALLEPLGGAGEAVLARLVYAPGGVEVTVEEMLKKIEGSLILSHKKQGEEAYNHLHSSVTYAVQVLRKQLAPAGLALATARPTAPAATGAAWVSVEEALPEAKDDYSGRLLCYGDGGIDGPHFVAYYCPSLRKWFLAHDNQPVMHVTHWQPLPSPPPTA